MPPMSRQRTPEMQAFVDQLQARFGGWTNPYEGTGHQGPGGQWIPTGPQPDLMGNWLAGLSPEARARLNQQRGQGSNAAAIWNWKMLQYKSGRGPHPGPHPISGVDSQMPAAPPPAPPGPPQPPLNTGPYRPHPAAGSYFPPGPPLPGEMYPTPTTGDYFAGGPGSQEPQTAYPSTGTTGLAPIGPTNVPANPTLPATSALGGGGEFAGGPRRTGNMGGRSYLDHLLGR